MDIKAQAYMEALAGFAYLVNVDMGDLAPRLDARLIDGLENGKAQKFEYTMEACWKAVKDFLKQREGIDEASPKKVIKAYYLAGYADEDDYLQLTQAIDDRNKLSHIYEAAEFQAILARLPAYLPILHRIAAVLNLES